MADDIGAMPTARATHASHRAALRRLGLSVGIAIALSGCGEVNEGVSCIFLPTGEAFEVTRTDSHLGGWDMRMARPGKVMFMTDTTADKWQCAVASGMSAGTAKTEGLGATPASPAPKGDAQ